MSGILDQLLSGSEDEDDLSASDADRLQILLNDNTDDNEHDLDYDYERSRGGDERQGGVRDLIDHLQDRDAAHFKYLETRTPDIESDIGTHREREGSRDVVLSRSPDTGIDITDYFDKQLSGKNTDVHFTKTPEPVLDMGLEWASDDVDTFDPTSTMNEKDTCRIYPDVMDNDAQISSPVRCREKSAESSVPSEEQYTYEELLERIEELSVAEEDAKDSQHQMAAQRLRYVSRLGCATAIEAPTTLQLGMRKITVAPQERAFSYVVRGDVRAETILGLVEQILISFGGTVLKPLPEDLNRMVQFNAAYHANSEWESVFAYLGANNRKQRVLVVTYVPAKSGSLFQSFSGKPVTDRSFDGFVLEIHEALCRALSAEGLNTPLSRAERKSEVYTEQLQTGQATTLDSVLDPHFVRDLHDTFIRELDVNLLTISNSLVDCVSNEEKQCARLMTLLRPIYDRTHLKMPTPPQKDHELSVFSVPYSTCQTHTQNPSTEGSNHSARQSSIEFSRLLILRARRQYLKEGKESGHRSEVDSVLSIIYDQLRQTCETTAQEVCQHRTALVANRINQIEAFKIDLINTLATRDLVEKDDKLVFSQFQSKFRVACESEPYILDFKATIQCSTTDIGASVSSSGSIGNNNRSGVAYITTTGLYFTSYEVFLLPMMQKVVPFNCVKNISVVKATMVQSDGVCLTDEGGEVVVLYVSSSTLNYAKRICDLLDVLVNLCKQSRNSSHNIGRGKSNGEQEIIQRGEDGAHSDTGGMEGQVRGENAEEDTLWMVRDKALQAMKTAEENSVSMHADTVMVENSDIVDNEAKSGDEATLNISTVEKKHIKSPLAMGIQAYLEKLQMQQPQSRKDNM